MTGLAVFNRKSFTLWSREVEMRHILAMAILCAGLAGCAVPSPFAVPNLGAPPGDENALGILQRNAAQLLFFLHVVVAH